MKKTIAFLVVVFSLLIFVSVSKAQEIGYMDEVSYLEYMEKSSYLGYTDGTGTSFELTDSNYLNISLESSNAVTLSLESIPETISINIKADPDVNFTDITLGGFLPHTVYYKYEDSYKNYTTFMADENGKYIFEQDISESHLIFIQPRPSTSFISDNETGGDCVSFGTWDIVTKTCTMTADLTGSIEISSDNVRLDGNQRKIVGSDTGSGVYLSERSGVTVKNLIISNFSTGIYLNKSNDINIEGNEALLNTNGIYLNFSNDISIVKTNFIHRNKFMGISLNNSHTNIIESNILRYNIYSGIILQDSNENIIENNFLKLNGDPSPYYSSGQAGILFENSNNNKISNNDIRDNHEYGIILKMSSSNNIIEKNKVETNEWTGILFSFSDENISVNNSFSANYRGVYLIFSEKNIMKNNIIVNNPHSGLDIWKSIDNLIYNNIFKNNTNLKLTGDDTTAFWNIEKTEGANIINGPYIGGNYWSNLADNGFSATCADSDYDGICDESYVIDDKNIDYYPLTKPDKLPPATSISFYGDAGANSWYTSEVEVALTAVDNQNGSGISKTEYSFDSSNWNTYVSPFVVNTEGYFTIYYRSMDNSGNIETVKSAILKIDTIAPIIEGSVETLPNLNNWHNSDVTLNFTCDDNMSGPVNSNFNVVINEEGSNLFHIGECKDNAGNSSFLVLSGINIDKTAPIVQSVLSPVPNSSGWNNTPVTAIFTAEDDISGIDGQAIINIILDQEGAGQIVSYTFADKAGNYTPYSVYSINIDLTPPEITGEAEILPNGENWYNLDVSIRFNCSDSLSGIESCSDDILISIEGADQSAIGTAIDIAGNLSSATVSGINIDKTAPQTSINIAGEEGISPWYVSDASVSLTANDGSLGSGIFKTEYSFNEIYWNDYSEPFIINEDAVIYFRSIDKAGNIELANMKIVRIDKTAPIISGEAATQPNSNDWYNESVTIHFTAYDLISGISRITPDIILEEEGEAQSAIGSASDNAGNEATFTVSGINIDKTPPYTEIVISKTIDNDFVSAGLEIAFLASDTFSGIENTIYNIDDSDEWVIYSESFLILEEGNHIVRYKSVDKAGNIEEEAVKEFVIDNTPPEAVIKFDIDSKDIKVYNAETGDEATYFILPFPDAESNLKLIDKFDKDSSKSDQSEKLAGYNLKEEQNGNENNGKNTDVEEKSNNSLNENEHSIEDISNQSSQNSNKNEEEVVANSINSESYVLKEKKKDLEFSSASNKDLNGESQNKENSKKIKKEKYDIEDLDESDIDENESEDDSESWELRQYTLGDATDNSLTIILRHKNEGKEAKAKIVSIKYGNGSALDIKQNKIYAAYSLDQDGSIKNLELKTTVKGQFDAKAKYMSKTNETEITIRLETEKKKTSEIWEDIVILSIVTDKGNLLLNY